MQQASLNLNLKKTRKQVLLEEMEQIVPLDELVYRIMDKRLDDKPNVIWHIAMRPDKRRAFDKDNAADALINQVKKINAIIRSIGRTPVAGNQVKVLVCEGVLPGNEGHHGTAHDAVCTIQSVDGLEQIDVSRDLSAPKILAGGLNGVKKPSWARKTSTD